MGPVDLLCIWNFTYDNNMAANAPVSTEVEGSLVEICISTLLVTDFFIKGTVTYILRLQAGSYL